MLVYGHLDKQPEMSGWRAGLGPWTPVIEDGRLYGRGGADDGYAVFCALAALRELEAAQRRRPRVAMLIECCEESGSYDLPAYLEALAPKIGTPELVIGLDSGCGNYDQLWGTTSLRGLVNGVLTVEVLTEGVHSGDASGMVASSFRVARMLLDRIDAPATGIVRHPAFHAPIPPVRADEAKRAAKVLGRELWRKFPFVEGMHPMEGDLDELVLARTWRPFLAVTGADGLPPPASAGNVLRPKTSLVLSMRLPPTLHAPRAALALKTLLESDPPYGARVSFEFGQAASGWHAPETAPWLAAALERASKAALRQADDVDGRGRHHPVHGDAGREVSRGAVPDHGRARAALQRARAERVPAPRLREEAHRLRGRRHCSAARSSVSSAAGSSTPCASACARRASSRSPGSSTGSAGSAAGVWLDQLAKARHRGGVGVAPGQARGVDQHEEVPGTLRLGGVVDPGHHVGQKARSGKHAREQVDRHRQARALVRAEGQQEPRQRRGGIGGGTAFLVRGPALGNRAAGLQRGADLAARGDAHRHVEDEVRAVRARRGDAERIVAQPQRLAAPRRHGGRGVGAGQHDEPGLAGDAAVGRDGAEVIARAAADVGDPGLARHLDPGFERAQADHRAERVAAVDERERRRAPLELGHRVRIDAAAAQAARVVGHPHRAVGRDAHQLGVDQDAHARRRVRGTRARGFERRGAEGFEGGDVDGFGFTCHVGGGLRLGAPLWGLTQFLEETTMAKAYWITCYRAISNQDKLQAYAKLAGPAIAAAGGKFLVRGTPAKVYEHGLAQRTVITEWDSVQAAIAGHDSPGYQEALRALGDAAERDVRVVEGA